MKPYFHAVLALAANLAFGLAPANPVFAATSDPLLRPIERKIQRVYQLVSPAIVRIVGELRGRERQLGCGVVVTPEGHIVTQGTIVGRHPRDGPLSVYLADGRQVKVSTLGWSGEWNIGALKISEEGPWPYVSLSDKPPSIRAGQYCLALGYPTYGFQDRQPAMRFGYIMKSAREAWCTSSCPVWMGDFGTGLFDLEGRLLGVCAEIPTEDDALYSVVDVVKRHWNDLLAGKDLDAVRLTLVDDRSPLRATNCSRDRPVTSEETGNISGLERATASTVRINVEGEPRGWSGVIISSDGYVATCAHHKWLPGTEVIVHLPSGRTAAGRILGMNWLTDVGLIKLSGDGPWPYAEIGDSTLLGINDACTIMGYPNAHRSDQPLIRTTKIQLIQGQEADAPGSRISTFRASTCEMQGGDSGGGLFDDQGRLIAIHEVVAPSHEHVRIEWLRRQWGLLSTGVEVEVSTSQSITALTTAFEKAAKNNKASTVLVLRNNEPQAVGIVVGANGSVLTKASEVYGEVACRMADGKTLSASVEKVDRKHDLALIRVNANNLPTATWSRSEPIKVGALVAAIMPSKEPSVGVVSQPARAIPADEGFLGRLRESGRGLEIDDDSAKERGIPLEKGDLVLSVEDHPTPDLKAFTQLMKHSASAPQAVAGDPVRLTVLRGQETMDLQFPLAPLRWPRAWGAEESRRYSGFPSVLDADLPLTTIECGAPLVNVDGEVAAIAIACRSRGRSHVVPAAIAYPFISE